VKIRFLIVGLGLLCPWLTVSAQSYVDDALRFSQTGLSGTTRFQAMGGVNTALGADLTSVGGNPAGMGFYRKSEWSITPSLNFTNNTGSMLNNSLSDGSAFFSIPNFGLVFSNVRPDTDKSDWRGGTWGFSYNRLQSFNNQRSYLGGVNRQNSIIDYLRSTADQLDIPARELEVNQDQIGFNVGYNQMLAQLAYNGFLIDGLDADRDGKFDPDNYYRSNLSANFRIGPKNELIEDPSEVRPSGTIRTTGGNNQWSFSYGGNYKDKLYIGATVGLATIRYSEKNDYTESVVSSTFSLLDNYTLTDRLDVSGTGINATLGLIYRINDVVRVGGSFTTPTIYQMTETSSTELLTNIRNRRAIPNFTTAPSYNLRSVDTDFEYRLTTPLRASLGAAIFLGKLGFISGDIEYRPYRAARVNGDFGVSAPGVNQSVVYNNEIRDVYRNLFNFRVGAEFRYDIFRLRGGVMIQDDPFSKNADNLKRTQVVYTAGTGVKLNSFFADLAVGYNTFQQAYTPYPLGPTATFQNRFITTSITIGSTF